MTPVPDERALLLRTVLHGGAWTLALRLASILFTFLFVGLLARALPPESMGAFFVCLSVAAFGGLMLQLGVPPLAVREIGKALVEGRPAEAEAFGRAVLAACLATAITTAALVGIVATAFPASVRALSLSGLEATLVAVIAGAIAVQSGVAEVFRGHRRIRSAALFGGALAAGLSWASCLVASHLAGPDGLTLTVALAICAAAGVGSALAGVACLPRAGPRVGWAGRIRSLVRQARAFWLNGIATFVFFQADLWVAALVLPLEQVAVYGAASRLVQPLALPIEAAEASLPPLIVGLYTGKRMGPLQKLLQKTARAQLALVLAGSVVLALAGEWLLAEIFGAHYRDGWILLVALCAGWTMRAAMGAYGHALMLTSHEGSMSRLTVVWASLCLPVEWLAGHFWGAVGVAAAAALMLGSFSVAGAWLAARRVGIHTSVWAGRATTHGR